MIVFNNLVITYLQRWETEYQIIHPRILAQGRINEFPKASGQGCVWCS